MPVGKPVVLSNGRTWLTQKAAEAHFRDIRDRNLLSGPIADPADIDDLLALVEGYDKGWTGEKKGARPIKHFTSAHNGADGRSTDSFFIHYEHGPDDDLSFIKAVRWISKAT